MHRLSDWCSLLAATPKQAVSFLDGLDSRRGSNLGAMAAENAMLLRGLLVHRLRGLDGLRIAREERHDVCWRE